MDLNSLIVFRSWYIYLELFMEMDLCTGMDGGNIRISNCNLAFLNNVIFLSIV